jgi:hypothetical protein
VPRHNFVRLEFNDVGKKGRKSQNESAIKFATMFELHRLWLGAFCRIFCTRQSLMLENLALRQQLAVLKRKHPRPRLGPLDKLFWVVVHGFWKGALVLVLPETVVRWHRAGSQLYWTMLSRENSNGNIPPREKANCLEMFYSYLFGQYEFLRDQQPLAPSQSGASLVLRQMDNALQHYWHGKAGPEPGSELDLV